MGETFQSIKNLKSFGHATKQLSQTRTSQHISKAIFDRVITYLAAPLQSNLSDRMHEIPCQNPTDGEAFINDTILLGESRIDGLPLTKMMPVSDPTVEK
jgi:hypothetical protein